MNNKRKEIKQKLKYGSLQIDNYFLQEIGQEPVKKRSHLFNNRMFDLNFQQNEERENKLTSKSGNVSYGVCVSCKSKNNSFIPIQTRRGDESMDYFIKCNNCGKVWHAD